MFGRCFAVIFSTSAPCSASVRAHVGPASTRVRSSTRTPASGRSPRGSGSGALSPMRMISISGNDAMAAAGATGGDDRFLEVERIPLRDGATDRVAILGHTEHPEGRLAVVRKIAVKV